MKTIESPPRTTPPGAALPLGWALRLIGWSGLGLGAAAGLLPVPLPLALGGGALAILVAGRLLARSIEASQAAHHLAQRHQVLVEVLSEVSGAAAQLGADARTLRDGVTEQSALAARQAAAVVETGATATEIAQTAKAATHHAEEVLQVVQRADDLSAQGQKVLERTVDTIRSLAEEVRRLSTAIGESAQRSRHIGEIVGGLKDLAENTSLLAVNASLEAVKAGEEGRGFAVVAAEMGNMAEQSLSAATEVRAILVEIEKSTKAAIRVAEDGSRQARGAMQLAGEAGQAIAGLTSALRDSSVAARQIANNTRQQGIGVEQIVAALAEMSGAAREAVAGTQSVEKATESISDLARRIDGTVVRLGGEATR